jgi:hypothetical protein
MKSATLKFGLVLALLCSLAPQACRARTLDNQSLSPSEFAANQAARTDQPGTHPFNLFACGSAATEITRDTPNPDTAIRLSLAMADFTGDTHPDLATVNLVRFGSFSAQYFIQVRLTEGGRQVLRLSAPPGGLFITPKDVTGDGTLDLVVRANFSHAVVAIFLNDGCGRFSRTEPASFAHAVGSDFPGLLLTANQPGFTASAIAQWSHQIDLNDRSHRRFQEKRTRGTCGDAAFLVSMPRSFYSNRAPPVVV